MKTASLFFMVVVFVVIAGCSDDNHTVMDVQIDVLMRSADGADLLNPATPGYYDASDITLYYVKNGIPEVYFEGNLERPHGFYIKQDDVSGKYILDIVPNYSDNEERVTLLEIKGVRTDTIKTTIMPNRKNNVTVGKVWLNDDLVWVNESLTPRQIELIFE